MEVWKDGGKEAEEGLSTAEPTAERIAGGGVPRGYRAPFLTYAIEVDGMLSEQEWGAVPWSDDFVDIEGGDRPAPPLRTRIKIAWNSEALFIAAELQEPHLWAEIEERDAVIWQEDDFEVFIDPNGDREEYYELEINARNTVFDLLLERTYIDGGPARHDWDIVGLKSAVKLDGTLNDPRDVDRGWIVELAWPWSALAERAHRSSPPKSGDRWRMNFSRVDWPLESLAEWPADEPTDEDGAEYQKRTGKPESNWVWSPQGEINMHLPEHWGFVEFWVPAESG